MSTLDSRRTRREANGDRVVYVARMVTAIALAVAAILRIAT
jgi:hypothetical protein